MFVEFLIKKFFQSCSARTGFTPMHDVFVALRVVKIFLIRSLYVKSYSFASTSNITFWWALKNPNRLNHFWVSQSTLFGSQGTELWQSNIYIGCFPLKAVYNSCKLQRLLKVVKFLFMQSLLTLTCEVQTCDFMWSSKKVFKDIKIFWTVHLRPFINNKVSIWICSEYSAAIFLALPCAT